MSHRINFSNMTDQEIKNTLGSIFPHLNNREIFELVEFVKNEEMQKKMDLTDMLIEDLQKKALKEIDDCFLDNEDIENKFNNDNVNFFKSNIIGDDNESSN